MPDPVTPPMSKSFMFPRWANFALPAIVAGAVGGMFYLPTLLGLAGSPATTAVGYAPEQPVPYSHALHVGKLGMDCRYCHNTVEQAGFAAIPPTQTCMNCHTGVKTESPLLAPVRESWKSGEPIPWVKVHDLPDYAYFNHSAHVTRGIGCVSCHGRIDQMDVVYQAAPLSMGWCLDCHREPERHLRPRDQVTNMGWSAVGHPYAVDDQGRAIEDPVEAQLAVGRRLKADNGVPDAQYMTSCYTCHR